MALPPSTKYPARVYFHTAKPGDIIALGYDSFRVERRKGYLEAWEAVTRGTVRLESGIYNYHFLDPNSVTGWEYRAVLQNSADPGTPVDLPQLPVKAVDASFESIMSIQEFKEIYLWGEDSAFIEDNGKFQPDYTFAHFLRAGIDRVEKELDLRFLPTPIVEKHDWEVEAHGSSSRADGLYFHLEEFPVISVEKVTLELPGSAPYEYPADWLRVKEDTGDLYVVPSGTLAPAAFGIGMGAHRFVPNAFRIEYTAGFGLGQCPAAIKEAVGKESSRGPLNVGGDLVGGAGLAGSSLSVDGLSQSVTTTNSSTNAGFGARIIQYDKELKAAYKKLRSYYKGVGLRLG